MASLEIELQVRARTERVEVHDTPEGVDNERIEDRRYLSDGLTGESSAGFKIFCLEEVCTTQVRAGFYTALTLLFSAVGVDQERR